MPGKLAARSRRRSTSRHRYSETIASSGAGRVSHSASGRWRCALVPRRVIFWDLFQTARPAYRGRRMISRTAVGAHEPVPALGDGTPSSFNRLAIRVSPSPSA
jgi:hypothetical protein